MILVISSFLGTNRLVTMVIIGIAGTASSGKSTVVEFLKQQGFHHLPLPKEEAPAEEPHRSSELKKEAKSVLNQALSIWEQNIVVDGFVHPLQLEVFKRRNYFYLIGVDGPTHLRYRLYKHKRNFSQLQLQEFIQLDDETKYGTGEGRVFLKDCLSAANKIIINQGTLENFISAIEDLKLETLSFRPSWESYFLSLAVAASTRSNCILRTSGCIVEKGKIIQATGYTGTPFHIPNCSEGACSSCSSMQETAECICLHAEMGCILDLPTRHAAGMTMYSTDFPCLACMKCIIQVGISKVTYIREEGNSEAAKALASRAGLELEHREEEWQLLD